MKVKVCKNKELKIACREEHSTGTTRAHALAKVKVDKDTVLKCVCCKSDQTDPTSLGRALVKVKAYGDKALSQRATDWHMQLGHVRALVVKSEGLQG